MFLSVTDRSNNRLANREAGYARVVILLALVGLLALAAWLRWQYALRVQPYPDEFVTLLAVQMILQKGLPILPSGLFYEHGLLFSYAGAVASALAGFGRETVRAASVACGVLGVWLVWRAGRRWFAPGVGLLAAAALAVVPSAVLWGGRARMYTLLQVWVLLAVTLALAGLADGRRLWRPKGPGTRWLALLCFLGAGLTHLVSLALVPPLLAGMAVFGWMEARRSGRKAWFLRDRSIWLEAAGWVAVVLIALLVKRLGQPSTAHSQPT